MSIAPACLYELTIRLAYPHTADQIRFHHTIWQVTDQIRLSIGIPASSDVTRLCVRLTVPIPIAPIAVTISTLSSDLHTNLRVCRSIGISNSRRDIRNC